VNEETLSTDLSNTLDALEAERARRQDAEHVLRHIAALPLLWWTVKNPDAEPRLDKNPAVEQARHYLDGVNHR